MVTSLISGLRRFIAVCLVGGFILTACGDGGDRSRNVESIAGTSCAKKGAVRTANGSNFVCGSAAQGKLWSGVSGKLNIKGLAACKSLGQFDAPKSRVCATVKKKSVWVKVSVPSAVVSTTVTPSTVVNQVDESASKSNVSQAINEVATAFTPPPAPATVDELIKQLEPRPVQAAEAPRVPTSLRVTGGAKDLANGTKFEKPLTITILDQNGDPLAAAGNIIVATADRPDVSLANVVATSDANGIATFDDLRLDGIAGPITVRFTADFTATTEFAFDLTPGSVTALRGLVEIGTVVVGEKLPVSPRIGLFDKDDNRVLREGMTLTAAFESKIIGTAKTDASGVAEFVGLSVDKKLASTGTTAGAITFSGTFDDASITFDQEVALVAGSPLRVEVVTQPSSTARANLPIPTQPIVRLVDKTGSPVAREGVTITASATVARVVDEVTIARVVDGATAVTNADGVAAFTNVTVGGNEGEVRLIFWSNIVVQREGRDVTYSSNVLSEPIKLEFGVAASVAIVKSTAVFASDVAVDAPFELAVVDAYGNVVTDYSSVMQIGFSDGLTINTAGRTRFTSGRCVIESIKIKGPAGQGRISFAASKDLDSPWFDIVVSPGLPHDISILNRPGTAKALSNLAAPLAVQLLDSAGNIVRTPNEIAVLRITGANTAGENAYTTSEGIATFSIRQFRTAGSTTARYEVEAQPVTPVTDVFTVVPGDVASVRLISANVLSERSGTVFATSPVVQLVDGAGNDVAQAGVQVTAKIVLGVMGGQIAGKATTTGTNGRATFAELVVTGPVGGYQLAFTPSGGLAAGNTSVALSAGRPWAIRISQQPGGAKNRVALWTQPAIYIVDSAGNAVKYEGLRIEAWLDGLVNSVDTDANGRATFSGVTAKGLVGPRKITFTSAGLTPAVSDSFDMAPGVADKIALVASPVGSAQARVIPSVKLLDIDDNVTLSTSSVMVSITSSAGTKSWLSGTVFSGINSSSVFAFDTTTASSTATAATLKYELIGTDVVKTVPLDFPTPLAIGDLGPAGGVIVHVIDKQLPPFIASASPASPYSAGGKFIEAAPAGWNADNPSDSPSDPWMKWGYRVASPAMVGFSSIGSAATNADTYVKYAQTLPVVPCCKSAIEKMADLVIGNYADWLLPTMAEMRAMFELARQNNASLGLSMNAPQNVYWTSSVDCCNAILPLTLSSTTLDYVYGPNWPQTQGQYFLVRPIRYFG